VTKPVRVQAPPGGWEDATIQEPSQDGDFLSAIWDNATLNENLNSEQEALEGAYELLVKRGEALGMQGLFNPYREDQTGEQRAPLGSAGRFLWQQAGDTMDGTPFGYESEGVRWKALQFEEQWKNEVLRLGDKAEAEGGWFDGRLTEGSRQAVALLSTTLRKDSLARLEAIKEARGSGFWSLDTLTEFGVGMGAAMNDPAQVATLFVGAPEALVGKSILGAAVKEAAVNASVEVMLQPGVQASKLDAGVIDDWQQAVGDGLTNVGIAGALGFAFGAGGKFVDNKLFAPGRERTAAFRALAKDIESVRFDDAAVQRSVMRMVGEVIEAEGPIQPSQSMADAFREAATKAADPAAAARLNAVASEVERALEPQEDADTKFERARTAMNALSRATAEDDPESAALVRKALAEAERDYATANQRPDTVPMEEFADAIESADARIRALEQFSSRPEPPLPEPKTRALDTTDDAPAPAVGSRLEEDGKAVTFTQFDPMQLGVAPDEMQYKRYSGAQGVNEAISDIQTWHAPSSGKVIVYERLDGSQVIVDGHQRRERARALTVRDGREDIRLDGYLYKEADGWTVAEMRLKGAQKNIREGRSDVLDTAQALRERPDAIDSSFPITRSNIRQARKLARLSPEAWDLTRAGVLEPQYAELIGAVAPDRPAMHAPLARTLIEAAPDNVRQAESIVSEALLDYAERNVSEQPMLFQDDGLGRGVMYRERAQIMDAAYASLRSDRSVFKALVDNGDIARAIGNELVDQANLNAKDQVDLAIAAVMHARRSGTRTAVSDMITRALDAVRREGVTPSRAGSQVAREIRQLVEARGFRALLEPEGPRPADMAEAGPLFDGPGSDAHATQADMLEMDLRPEGREDPDVDLKKIAEPVDPLASLMNEVAGAREAGGRPIEEVFAEIRALLKPKGEEAGVQRDVRAEAKQERRALEQAEKAVRDAIAPLTDAQKVQAIRMQYPDAYAPLMRLEGGDLDDAIVGRVLAGDLRFGRRGAPGSDVTYTPFYNNGLPPTQNKIVEMALNNYTNLEIATEMGISLASVSSELSRARRVLKQVGIDIPKGITGKTLDGQRPGALQEAIYRLADEGLESAQIHERLSSEGLETTVRTVYTYYSRWKAAKRDGQKFSLRYLPMDEASRMERAREQGFDVDTPLYVGRRGNYDELKPGTNAYLGKQTEGVSVTSDPKWARAHATEKGNVQTVYVRGRFADAAEYNAIRDKIERRLMRGARREDVRALQEQATIEAQNELRKLGYAGFRNPEEAEIRIFDPKNIRRTDAAFDPSQQGSSKLLASVGLNPAGATRAEIIERISAEFGDGASALVRTADLNVADIPPAWAAPDTMGITDAQGRVTLFANNVSPGDVRGLVLHEIGVHAGLESILGAQGKVQLLDQIAARIDAGHEATMTALARVPSDTDPANLNEEVLAYLIQYAPKTDIVQQLIADIRAWLYRTLPMLRDWMTLTDTDLQSLAMGAVRQRIKEANWSTPVGRTKTGAPFIEPIRYASQTQSPYIEPGSTRALVYDLLQAGTKRRDIVQRVTEQAGVGRSAVYPIVNELREGMARGVAYKVASDPNGWLPRLQSAYEPRDLILMFNDGLDDGRIAAELGISLGRPVKAEVVAVQLSKVRNALKEVRADAGRYQALSDAIAVDPAELDAFIEESGRAWRIPTLIGEARRLTESGVVEHADIVAGLRKWALQNKSSGEQPSQASLEVSASRARGEIGKAVDKRNTVTTPEMRAEIITLRRSGLSVREIVGQLGVPYRTAISAISNARGRGEAFPSMALGRNQPAFSTGPVKYARRGNDGSRGATGSGEPEISGGAGRPGQPDVRADGASGQGAAGSGTGQRGAQSRRAVATEPLPEAPADAGLVEWNERFNLSPEQRAARREQFRDFVENAVVEPDVSTIRTDWVFKSGKRVIAMAARAAESRRYVVRATDDMHPSWREALDPEETSLIAEVHGNEATIHHSSLSDELRSTGMGQKLYTRAIDDLLAQGITVNSDVSVSENAMALWKSLRGLGYDVIQRVPDRLLERGDDLSFSHRDNSTAIFFVARKKPPPPELPASNRDLMQRIDEARSLSEHMATCVKGKG
jgi:hypothetical protein